MQYRISRRPTLEPENDYSRASGMMPRPASAGPGFHLPPDLSRLASLHTLRMWIEAEVDKLKWDHPQVLEYLRQRPAYRPRSLLALLSLAYAAQVFSSEEIIRACRSQPVFWLACGGVVPFAHEVRRFRWKNRPLLERVLAGVFRQAVCQRFDLAPGMLPSSLEADLHAHAVERLSIARDLDSADA